MCIQDSLVPPLGRELPAVPVLPAAERPPSRLLPEPVPLVRTVLRILVTPLATSGSRTFLHWLLGSLSALWSLVVIASTGEGGQYVPPEATVAYAEAKVSGEVGFAPNVTGPGRARSACRRPGAAPSGSSGSGPSRPPA